MILTENNLRNISLPSISIPIPVIFVFHHFDIFMMIILESFQVMSRSSTVDSLTEEVLCFRNEAFSDLIEQHWQYYSGNYTSTRYLFG